MMMKCSLFGTFWDQVLVVGGSKNISLQANIFLSVWECNLLCVFQLNHTVLLVKLCRMNINFWIICLFSVIYYITQDFKISTYYRILHSLMKWLTLTGREFLKELSMQKEQVHKDFMLCGSISCTSDAVFFYTVELRLSERLLSETLIIRTRL